MIELVMVIYLLIGFALGICFKPLKVSNDTGVNAAFMAIAWYPVVFLGVLLWVISLANMAIKKLAGGTTK